MRVHLNHVLAGILAVSLLGLTGCSAKSLEPETNIYVICKSQNEYWDTTKAGALEAGEEMNLNVIYEAPETEDMIDAQISMIDQAITEGAQAIVVAPLDTDALNEVLERAVNANVPVLTIDSEVSYEGIQSHISTQNYSAGAIAARYAASLLEKTGDVAIISHGEEIQTALQRTDGFTDELEGTGESYMPVGMRMEDTEATTDAETTAEDGEMTPPAPDMPEEDAGAFGGGVEQAGYPQMHIIETKYGNGDIDESRMATIQLIKENPDLKLIYATNQPGTIGACQAIDELNVGNKVQLIGFDYFEGADAYITSGVLDAVIAQNPYNMGYLGVRYAYKITQGASVAANVDTGATLVTADNMNDEDIRFLVNPTGK